MVYKRYIKKNGKIYGPYEYHSRKEKGKVISEYRGKVTKNKKNFFSLLIIGIFFLFSLIFVLNSNIVDMGVLTETISNIKFPSTNFLGSIVGFVISENLVDESSEEQTGEPTSADEGVDETEQVQEPVEEIINESISKEPVVNKTDIDIINETISQNDTIIRDENITSENNTIVVSANESINYSQEEISNVTNETIIQDENQIIIEENITIIITETNATITTIQLTPQITLGQPVKWKKNVQLDKPGKTIVKIPKEAKNVVINKVLDKQEARFSITGGVVSEGGWRDSFLLRFFRKIFENLQGSVTGKVVQEPMEVQEIEIDDTAIEYEIEYETPAPYAIEQDLEKGKRVKIVGPETIRYENVLSFTNLSENLNIKDSSRVRIYWVEDNSYVPIKTIEDKNSNGIYDYIEWITPHLSNQTFDIIVITKAEHLDSNKNFISDIYEEVKELDDVWSEEINSGEYVRVTFEINLTSDRDITIYPRVVSGNPRVEVYEVDGLEVIAEFTIINSNEYNKVLLTNLIGEQDSFDLLILDGSLEFDHIVDPPGKLSDDGVIAFADASIEIGGTTTLTEPLTHNGKDPENWNIFLEDSSANRIFDVCGANDIKTIAVSEDSADCVPASTNAAFNDYVSCTNLGTSVSVTFTVEGCTGGTETYNLEMTTDTGGQDSFTGSDSLTVNSADDPPTWSNPSVNDSTPTPPTDVRHNVLWEDDTDLSYATLEINSTGAICDTLANVTSTTLSGTSSWANLTWQIPNACEGKTIGWKQYANDSANNWNVTDLQTYTVQNINPILTFGTNPIDNYNSSSSSVTFELKVSDNLGVDELQLYGNWMGSWVSNQTNSTPVNDTVWSITVNNIPEGIGHIWAAWGNDTLGNSAFTSINRTFTVDLTAPSLSGEGANETGITQNNYFCLNVTATDSGVGVDTVYAEVWNTISWVNYTMSEDGTSCDGTASDGIYGVEIQGATVGLWNYSKVYANDTVNNLNVYDFTDKTINVTSPPDSYYPQFSSFQEYLTNNSDYSFGQNYQFNSTIINTNGTVFLEFGGTNYSATNDTPSNFYVDFTSLAAGTSNYYWWGYGNGTNENYNSSSTKAYVIKKINPAASLTNNDSWTVTYPSVGVQIGYSESNGGDGDVTYKVYRDGVDKGSGEIVSLAASTYNYILNTTGGTNYTSNSSLESQTFTVNQNTGSCGVLFNETSPIIYPSIFLVWTNCTSASTLYRNGTTVSNNSVQNLAASSYNFTVVRTDGANYSNTYEEKTFVVSQATGSVFTYLDNARANKSILLNNEIYLNATLQVGVGNIKLYYNNTLINQGASPLANLTNFTGEGTFNVSGIYDGNENYTSSTETWWVIVSSDSPPTATIIYPQNIIYNNDVTELNYTASDDISLDKCWYSTDGGATNSSTQTCGVNFTGLTSSEGSNTWTIYANDSVGQESLDSVTFNKDTIYPVFSSYARNPTTPNEDENVQLNVTITESNLDVVILEFNNGTLTNYTVTTNNGDEFYFTILTGNYTAHDSVTYYWYANDTANNLNKSAQQSFTVANQIPSVSAPTINDTTPQTNDLISCDGGTFSDDDAEDSETSREFKWYDDDVEVSGQTSQTLDLSVGGLDKSDVIKCSARVSDSFDFSSWVNSSNTAIIQNSAPVITNPQTAVSWNANGSAFTYDYDYTDADGDGQTWYDNTTLFNINATGYISDTPIESEVGSYEIRISVSDGTVNATDDFTYAINDVTFPNIDFVSPTELNNSQLTRNYIQVNVTASDGKALDTITIYLYNSTSLVQTNTSLTSPLFVNFTNLPDEVYYFNSTVNDTSGNINQTETRTVTTDTGAPTVNYVLPTEDSGVYINRNYVEINVTASDPNLDKIVIRLYNSTNNLINSSTTSTSPNYINFSGLNDGLYYYNVTANDTFSNENSLTTRNITLDTTNPVVVMVYPQNKSYTIDIIDLNYNYTETNPDKCWYSLDGGATNSSTQTCGANWTGLTSTEGSNTWTVYINDTSGNENSNSVTFNKDTLNPSVSINSPSAQNYTTTTITFNITAADGGGISSCLYSLNAGTTNTSLTNSAGDFWTDINLSMTQGSHTVNYYCNDTLNNWNDTEQVTFFIDSIYPSITTLVESPTDPTTYSAGQKYEFNVTITDDNLGTVLIEFGGVNYTPSNLVGDIYNFSITDLAAGTYDYYWWANDSAGNVNLTSDTYTINNATGDVTLLINGTAGNQNGIYGIQTNASTSTSYGSVTLYRNGTDVTSQNNNFVTLAANYYNYTAVSGGDQNHSSVSTTLFVDISKASSEVNLILNVTDGNVTIVQDSEIYLNTTTISGDSGATLKMYNDNSLINQGTSPLSNLTTFSTVRVFNITGFYIESENYTGSFETWWVNVTETPDITNPVVSSLTESPSDPATFDTGNIYEFNATITDNRNLSVILFEFGGVNYTPSNLAGDVYNYTFSGLEVGTYNYRWYANDTSGNTNNTENGSYTINQATPSLNLVITPSTSETYGTETTATGSVCPSQITCNLYKDDILVSTPDVKTLTAGTYNYTYNTTGNTNYTSTSTSTILIVSKATGSVFTYLDNSRANKTIEQFTEIYINGTLQTGLGDIKLYNNGTLINQGVSPLSNLTNFSTVGLYNITTIYDGNENYTSSTETWWVDVTEADVTPPQISLVYPTNISYMVVQTELNYTATDNIGLDTCWYSLDGGTSNTTVICGTNITGLDSGQGGLTWTIYGNDSKGNENSSSITFFVDSINPTIEFVSPTETDGSSLSRNYIQVNITASDSNLANITVRLYNSTIDLVQENTSTSSPFFINYTGLSDSLYFFNSTVSDTLNNQNSTETRNVFLIIPTLTIIKPENETYLTNENLLLNYSVTDEDFVWYNLDSGSNTTIIFPINFNTTEGAHTLYLYANNSNGVTTKNVAFTVNLTKFNIIYNTWKGSVKGSSTDFNTYSYEDLQNLSEIVFENTGSGKITFNEAVNVTDNTEADLDTYVNISFNRIELDSGVLPNFDKSATLYLYNLTFTDPLILKDGETCSSSICEENSYSGGTLSFNVTGFSVYSAKETPAGVGVVQSSEGGGGSSGGSIADFLVNTNLITLKLKQGDIVREEIIITNQRGGDLEFNLKVEGIEKYVILSEESFTLSGGESKNIYADFFASEEEPAGVHAGRIIIEANSVKKSINVILEIKERVALFDIRSELADETISKSQKLKAKISIINIGDLNKSVDVVLEYFIKDFEENEIKIEEETVGVSGALEINRKFSIPKILETGDYLFYVKLTYLDSVATSANRFSLVDEYLIVTFLRQNSQILITIFGVVILFLLYNRRKKKYSKTYMEIRYSWKRLLLDKIEGVYLKIKNKFKSISLDYRRTKVHKKRKSGYYAKEFYDVLKLVVYLFKGIIGERKRKRNKKVIEKEKLELDLDQKPEVEVKQPIEDIRKVKKEHVKETIEMHEEPEVSEDETKALEEFYQKVGGQEIIKKEPTKIGKEESKDIIKESGNEIKREKKIWEKEDSNENLPESKSVKTEENTKDIIEDIAEKEEKKAEEKSVEEEKKEE